MEGVSLSQNRATGPPGLPFARGALGTGNARPGRVPAQRTPPVLRPRRAASPRERPVFTRLEAEKSGRNCRELRFLVAPLPEASPPLVLFPPLTDWPEFAWNPSFWSTEYSAPHGQTLRSFSTQNSTFLKLTFPLRAPFPGPETQGPPFCTLSSSCRRCPTPKSRPSPPMSQPHQAVPCAQAAWPGHRPSTPSSLRVSQPT